MGQLTSEIFNESCCDGGECSTSGQSTQSCGCDPGIDYISPSCWLHKPGLTEAQRKVGQELTEKFKQIEERKIKVEDTKVYGKPMEGTAQWRKERPVYSGVLAYFPDAILEVAYVSYKGNEQHNPGQPLHWAREKSTDQLDCVARHLIDHAKNIPDDNGMGLHLAKVAWRALAELQLYLEREKSSSSSSS